MDISNEYLRNAVMTASPEQLQLMLYDGAIRFTRQGITGLEQKNWEDVFNGFSKAQKIVLEMVNGLNYDVDPELCKRTAGLYNFIYRKLVDASVNRDLELANESLKLLEYQRETWVLLLEKLHKERMAKPSMQPAVHDHAESPYSTLSVEG